MIKPEKFGHLHLVYHFTIPLRKLLEWNIHLQVQLYVDFVFCALLVYTSTIQYIAWVVFFL